MQASKQQLIPQPRDSDADDDNYHSDLTGSTDGEDDDDDDDDDDDQIEQGHGAATLTEAPTGAQTAENSDQAEEE